MSRLFDPKNASPKEKTARSIVSRLRKAGFEAVFAGGCVRDTLRGETPKDFDIATSATPEAIQELFKKTIPVGVQFGVILVIEGGTHFEVATFRKESDYTDGRHPGKVAFATLEEDAQRRDFTVNGLYYDPEKEEVIDLVGGRADLDKKIIRAIGNAEERFLEDHLRMFRAIRFAAQLNFDIEPDVLVTIKKHAERITKVSQERIRDELSKLFISGQSAKGIRLLDETGLLAHTIPEVLVLKNVEQPAQYHPEGDVYVHTLLLLEGLKAGEPVELGMACLLHDIAKPATFVRAEDRIRFHGHDRIGAEMSKKICKRLTFSNDQTELICALVREHLRFKDAFQMRKSTLRRFFSLDRFDLHLRLHWLDCMASHQNLEAYEFCQKKLAEFAAEPPPPKKLISGDDLLSLGYTSGRTLGKVLRAVEDQVLEGEIKTREEALAWVKKHHPAPSREKTG